MEKWDELLKRNSMKLSYLKAEYMAVKREQEHGHITVDNHIQNVQIKKKPEFLYKSRLHN